jgi:hypothetical protein
MFIKNRISQFVNNEHLAKVYNFVLERCGLISFDSSFDRSLYISLYLS